MKYLINNFLVDLLLININTISIGKDSDLLTAEVIFTNNTNSAVYIKCYPISLVFNAYNNYSILAKRNWNNFSSNLRFDYNNGVYLKRTLPDTNQTKKTFLEIPANGQRGFQTDQADDDEDNYGSVGFGKYKIIFYSDEGLNTVLDTVTLEYDAGYGVTLSPDIEFTVNSGGRISFHWSGGCEERNIYDSDVNRKIESWNQFESGSRSKDLGNFQYDASNNNNYQIFPQDSRKDCDVLTGVPEENQVFDDNRNAILTLNLTINKDIYTRNILENNPTNIVVTKKTFLKINSNKTFEMITPSSPSGGYNNLMIQDSGVLVMSGNLILNSPNKMILEYGSNLTFHANSLITFYPGSSFCNYGAKIHGPGRFWFKPGLHVLDCRPNDKIILFQDSTNLILDSNTILEIPDSTTLKFKGNQTALKLTPTSKLKMGVNSKLVFEDEARMISRNSTLIAKDTTNKWGGIFSYDDSPDTIVNTKIINAVDGINLIDKFNQPNIIQDCEFINKCSGDLSTGIYINNSEKTLIRGNHFYSETSGKFDNAVYLEYCTANELNVIDNNIEDCTNGIIDIGSWSYIARNTITGDEGEGIGIYLDNYSGNIKYNKIENFEHSVFMLVSDAYLYRNIFKNASNANLELESYSIPLLRPIISGELKYWVAGDNTVDISNIGVGIILGDDSYPHIKDGYNKFYLNSALYFITGQVPAEFADSLEARNNYWNSSASPSKFSLTNATVKYSPTEDGSAGNRIFNTIIPMSIGFGLWDTINILDESDNPVITDLFLLGNNKLVNGNYEDAIVDFKDVVTSNDTVFTNLALKKIYYCYERSDFFGSDYSSAKNYFNSINSDTHYSSTSRGIAKDLYLKVKFKNGEYESAVDEYNTMYENNQNNPLGLHALINKTILENITGGDNFGGEQTSPENIAEHKKQVLQLLNLNENSAKKGIRNKNFLTSDYGLEQNYPNPFNPSTVIRYQLAVSSFVSLKIYNVIGKEIVTLVNENKPAGKYSVQFDGNNLPSGIYFFKLEAGNFFTIKKMMLIK